MCCIWQVVFHSWQVVYKEVVLTMYTCVTADKLSHIDAEFSAQSKSNEPTGSVEERMLSYQRKIELASSQKAQQDLERWKRMEMETIQITEREKIQRELQDRRRQVIYY